ncbi:MAG: Mediator of RNA polymerase II transcription subunit 7 [Pleopsidium flavum]|nr:MAG: Mediator of RNA polymerase II transcription subunit 7 [Pleopsidium flavum]
MTDQQQPGAISAAFPAPPPFYKHFTSQNLARLKELQQQAEPNTTATESTNSPSHLLDLPPELRFLIPPEPPSLGIYKSFGDQYNINDILPTLASQSIPQLYPTRPSTPTTTSTQASEWTFDHAHHLRTLSKSLLLNFLELIGTLSINPEQYGRKIEDLRTVFVNMHHLINEYRPHQARETLIGMMEEQVERCRGEVKGVREMREKVEGILEGLGRGGAVGEEGVEVEEVEERKGRRRREEDRRVWEALERELGDGVEQQDV